MVFVPSVDPMARNQCSLLEPRPKRARKDETLQPSLPIPINSLRDKTAFHGQWPRYEGYLIEETGQVRIPDLDQAVKLFTNGFFGDKEIPDDQQSEAQHCPELKPFHPKIDPETQNDTLRKLSRSVDEDTKNESGKVIHRPHMNERWPLVLAPEEAYFLSYALGCLIVRQNGRELNLYELWRVLVSRDEQFPVLYRVYHHFRAKGWVVRNGLKFGANFLLYQDGPPFFHSTYSVKIQVNTLNEAMSWRELFGLNRITEATSKELMLVEIDGDGQAFERVQDSPENLGELYLKEVLVRRWVPSQKQ